MKQSRENPTLRAGQILSVLRRRDITCSIDSFGAKGWTARLGDPGKGFYAQQGRFLTLDAAAHWLLEEARRQFPGDADQWPLQ
jgi:hypothetical protein